MHRTPPRTLTESDRQIRKLERDAASGDEEAANTLARKLRSLRGPAIHASADRRIRQDLKIENIPSAFMAPDDLGFMKTDKKHMRRLLAQLKRGGVEETTLREVLDSYMLVIDNIYNQPAPPEYNPAADPHFPRSQLAQLLTTLTVLRELARLHGVPYKQVSARSMWQMYRAK